MANWASALVAYIKKPYLHTDVIVSGQLKATVFARLHAPFAQSRLAIHHGLVADHRTETSTESQKVVIRGSERMKMSRKAMSEVCGVREPHASRRTGWLDH